MPRIGWFCAVLVGACSFHAVYDGHYTCSDGQCPSGYTCTAAKQCVLPGTIDAARGDGSGEADARQAALTCADPGAVPAAGATEMGTTVGRSNTVSAMCGGLVFNGPDAVYRFDAASAGTLTISILASYAANAYVITPCTLAPATPTCVQDEVAAPAAPLVFEAPAAGMYFIVVDGVDAALTGTYTLTIANP